MMEPAVLLDAWATTMWRACWQGSLVVLGVWSICRLMPSMPASFQCWFWRLAVLKFFVVPLLPALFDFPLLPVPSVATSEHQTEVALTLPTIPGDQVQLSRSHETGLPKSGAILFVAWMIGVGWSTARLLATWRDVAWLQQGSLKIDNVPMLEQLAHAARAFGLRTTPRLLGVTGEGSPMLIGILRPLIVIPSETLNRLNSSEQAIVLEHELAHMRRGDLLWSLVAALVRVVFFFHPVVWFSQRRLNLLQEIAADELAIARQRHDPVSYGKLLVSVVGKLGPARLLPIIARCTPQR